MTTTFNPGALFGYYGNNNVNINNALIKTDATKVETSVTVNVPYGPINGNIGATADDKGNTKTSASFKVTNGFVSAGASLTGEKKADGSSSIKASTNVTAKVETPTNAASAVASFTTGVATTATGGTNVSVGGSVSGSFSTTGTATAGTATVTVTQSKTVTLSGAVTVLITR